MIPKFPIIVHIYIFNSYICISKWGKLEIPKLTIQRYIYILFTLIYVCLIGQNWKSKKKDKI